MKIIYGALVFQTMTRGTGVIYDQQSMDLIIGTNLIKLKNTPKSEHVQKMHRGIHTCYVDRVKINKRSS